MACLLLKAYIPMKLSFGFPFDFFLRPVINLMLSLTLDGRVGHNVRF